jgi:hypothetical protein
MKPLARNGLIDVMRLFGAIGIVLFHTSPHGRSVTYAALPMFIALLVILQDNRDDVVALLRGRARRLLWPWVLWSGLHLILSAARWGHGGHLPPLRWTMLLTGPVLALWFLPFAFVCAGIVFALDKLTGRVAARQVAWQALGALLFVAILPAQALLPLGLPSPLPQWSLGLAAAAFGLAIRWNRSTPGGLVKVLILMLLSVVLAWWIAPGRAEWSAVGLGGIVTLTAFLCPVLPSSDWTRACVPISFLVYLVHPVMAVIVWYGAPVPAPWVQAPLILAGSLVFAVVAWRTGLARWLL